MRKMSYGTGVERIFPLHSPLIEKIELVSRGKVRRGRIYYMRELKGKAARIKEKLDGILQSHQAPPLSDKVLAAIASIRERGVEALSKT